MLRELNSAVVELSLWLACRGTHAASFLVSASATVEKFIGHREEAEQELDLDDEDEDEEDIEPCELEQLATPNLPDEPL